MDEYTQLRKQASSEVRYLRPFSGQFETCPILPAGFVSVQDFKNALIYHCRLIGLQLPPSS
jgi:hypothetical protein